MRLPMRCARPRMTSSTCCGRPTHSSHTRGSRRRTSSPAGRGYDPCCGRPRAPRVPTDRLPLPGGETADLEGLVKAAMDRGASDRTARHLVARYGSESAAVLNLVDRDRALGRPIVAGRPALWAEVAHAVEREMAVRLSDVLVRRLHLFYATSDQGVPAASPVAEWLAEPLGWDATRRAEEVTGYRELVERSRAFAKEAATVGES